MDLAHWVFAPDATCFLLDSAFLHVSPTILRKLSPISRSPCWGPGMGPGPGLGKGGMGPMPAGAIDFSPLLSWCFSMFFQVQWAKVWALPWEWGQGLRALPPCLFLELLRHISSWTFLDTFLHRRIPYSLGQGWAAKAWAAVVWSQDEQLCDC